MLSTCVDPPPPPLVLLPPPQPAKPAAMPTIKRAQARAYTSLRRAGTPLRRMLTIRSKVSTQVTRVRGAAGGTRGVRLTLKSGETLVVGSERPDELAAAIRASGKVN